MSNASRDSISRYRRQLSRDELGRAGTLMGANDPGTFDSTAIYFAADYEDLSPPETSGFSWNGRGSVVEYALPAVPPETIEIVIHDWDVDLRMQLEAWQFARTDIRWWAPGSHFVAGKIAKVEINRPAKGKLKVTIRCRGIFYYDTSTSSQLNTAFPSNLVSHGRLYGDQA